MKKSFTKIVLDFWQEISQFFSFRKCHRKAVSSAILKAVHTFKPTLIFKSRKKSIIHTYIKLSLNTCMRKHVFIPSIKISSVLFNNITLDKRFL